MPKIFYHKKIFELALPKTKGHIYRNKIIYVDFFKKNNGTYDAKESVLKSEDKLYSKSFVFRASTSVN